MATMTQDLAPDTLEVEMNYHLDTGEIPWTFTGGKGSTERRSGSKQETHRVVLHNGRPHIPEFALDVHGFRFVDHHTKMRDFYDEDEIVRTYYPEMEELIKREAGAKRVVVFDHTVRLADENERETRKLREPVLRAHNDYTEWSAPQRVRDIMGDEAENLLTRRFAIVQCWRPINKPIESYPLAICDARSIAFEDFVVSERRYPGRVGQTYATRYSPKHHWYWFPRMTRQEALVFKVFDSERTVARWTSHSAFNDPTSPPNAAPRESIEIRTLAFF